MNKVSKIKFKVKKLLASVTFFLNSNKNHCEGNQSFTEGDYILSASNIYLINK